MNDWEIFIREGNQYLQAARGKQGRPSKLSNDIRYNLLALSLEKSMMGMIIYHHDLADNHTFSDLLASLGRHVDVAPEIYQELVSLEQVQSLCNMVEYHREIPDDHVVERMVKAAEVIYALAVQTCRVPENIDRQIY